MSACTSARPCVQYFHNLSAMAVCDARPLAFEPSAAPAVMTHPKVRRFVSAATVSSWPASQPSVGEGKSASFTSPPVTRSSSTNAALRPPSIVSSPSNQPCVWVTTTKRHAASG